MSQVGRNDPCHCGSGKKYKKCHLEKDENKDRKVREKAALNAAKVAAEKAEQEAKGQPAQKKDGNNKGWIGKVASKFNPFGGGAGGSHKRVFGNKKMGG